MLLYLSGQSRPDIAFAVHQVARYTYKPTRWHELALVRIGRYLKGTNDKGIDMGDQDVEVTIHPPEVDNPPPPVASNPPPAFFSNPIQRVDGKMIRRRMQLRLMPSPNHMVRIPQSAVDI
jgi:hypothetical protein